MPTIAGANRYAGADKIVQLSDTTGQRWERKSISSTFSSRPKISKTRITKAGEFHDTFLKLNLDGSVRVGLTFKATISSFRFFHTEHNVPVYITLRNLQGDAKNFSKSDIRALLDEATQKHLPRLRKQSRTTSWFRMFHTITSLRLSHIDQRVDTIHERINETYRNLYNNNETVDFCLSPTIIKGGRIRLVWDAVRPLDDILDNKQSELKSQIIQSNNDIIEITRNIDNYI